MAHVTGGDALPGRRFRLFGFEKRRRQGREDLAEADPQVFGLADVFLGRAEDRMAGALLDPDCLSANRSTFDFTFSTKEPPKVTLLR
jgi:hypothetical protein